MACRTGITIVQSNCELEPARFDVVGRWMGLVAAAAEVGLRGGAGEGMACHHPHYPQA